MDRNAATITEVQEHEDGNFYVWADVAGGTLCFMFGPKALANRKDVYDLATDEEAMLAILDEHLDRLEQAGRTSITRSVPDPSSMRRVRGRRPQWAGRKTLRHGREQ